MNRATVLHGRQLRDEDFVAVEAQTLESEQLLRVLEGRLAVLLVRHALSPSEASIITDRFWSSPGRQPRPDGVAGFYVGAYQYGKSFERYRAEIAASNEYVKMLFAGVQDPVALVIGQMRAAVGQDAEVRKARWRDLDAAYARALAWTAEGHYLLAPHDDLGQLSQPEQKDFEIQKARRNTVVAVNIYPKVPKPGGDLRFWNLIPDDSSRLALGIEHTGYPYPPEALEQLPYLDVSVETGDIAIANGGLIHAVGGYGMDADRAGERLIINFFLGHVTPRTVVHWV
ncbi:hypothetical protein [Micromonospora sp. NPDC049891]|uniref:hypothetical protein n=1 Tax=Micromonospora sp. NPDC049891 TaxID=3155655 RepID=UPI00340387FA